MEESKLETLRHSASHIMAEAVKELYPDVKLAIGPSIDTGFYYDFDMPTVLTEEDLPKIEAKMKEIAKRDEKFERSEVKKGEQTDQPVQAGDVVMMDRSVIGAVPYSLYEIFTKFGTGMYLPAP